MKLRESLKAPACGPIRVVYRLNASVGWATVLTSSGTLAASDRAKTYLITGIGGQTGP
jgi:hypothetical protein